MPEYTDLGYLNDFYDHPPEEYLRCRGAQHSLQETKVPRYRAVTKYTCPVCRVVFYVDSSD